jgi:hypothetical protein
VVEAVQVVVETPMVALAGVLVVFEFLPLNHLLQ